MRVLQITKFFLIAALITFTISEKQNIIDNFHHESLQDFITSHKFVFVTITKKNSKFGKRIKKIVSKLAKNLIKSEIIFLRIEKSEIPEEKLKTFITAKNENILFFIYGHKKKFHSKKNYEEISNWVNELNSAKPIMKKSIENIEKEDSHYFIYISEELYDHNFTHINVLAKLVSPLSIYYGFEKKELKKIILKNENFENDKKLESENEGNSGNRQIVGNLEIDNISDFFIFRDYEKRLIDIDVNFTLLEKSEFIIRNEFPDVIVPNQESFSLLFDLKIPSVIFFTKNVDSEKIKMIKEISLEYKEYFVLTIVDMRKKNKFSKIFCNFMKVKKSENLRILNMSNGIKRYKYHGKLEKPIIKNFFKNYILNNLKPYKINQKKKKNQKFLNIKIGNFKTYKKLLKDDSKTYIIYVYQNSSIKKDHFEILEFIEDILRENLNLEIFAIDHEKNDLDGYYNDSLPFLFLKTRLGKIEHFENLFELDLLVQFIASKLPYIQMTEPEYEYDFDEL